MEITIGKLSLVDSQTLLIPKGEHPWLELNISGWKIKLNCRFINTKKAHTEQTVTLENKNDHAVITLHNWNRSSWTSLKTPLVIGRINNRAISTMFATHAIGEIINFNIQIFVEDKK
jgi:hypothetical protein